MRLILLRHGETDWNVQDRFQGGTDIALNARGEVQARSTAAGAVGELLRDSEDLLVLCSPLARATRTAEILLDAAVGDVRPVIEPGLAELGGGEWEGLELTEIGRRWPDEHRAWRLVPDLDAGPVGGEILRAGGRRVLEALSAHAGGGGTDASGSRRTLLVVAHGGVLRAAVGLLLGLEGEAFADLARLRNARAAVLEGTSDADGAVTPGRWELRGYNV